MKLLSTMLVAVLLISCSSISAEQEYRINILYAHTQIMIQSTSAEDANAIGMSPDRFVSADQPVQQLQVLEQTMNIPSQGDLDERIVAAEQRMSKLMVLWSQTPSAKTS
jgi:hypothetical protein